MDASDRVRARITDQTDEKALLEMCRQEIADDHPFWSWKSVRRAAVRMCSALDGCIRKETPWEELGD